jgi:hypothetical protein
MKQICEMNLFGLLCPLEPNCHKIRICEVKGFLHTFLPRPRTNDKAGYPWLWQLPLSSLWHQLQPHSSSETKLPWFCRLKVAR